MQNYAIVRLSVNFIITVIKDGNAEYNSARGFAMIIKFSDLKKKKVVNILDGRVLGKICDVIFTYPEGKICEFVVSNGIFSKEDYVFGLCCVNKIGDDAVLVSLKETCAAGKQDDE